MNFNDLYLSKNTKLFIANKAIILSRKCHGEGQVKFCQKFKIVHLYNKVVTLSSECHGRQ